MFVAKQNAPFCLSELPTRKVLKTPNEAVSYRDQKRSGKKDKRPKGAS